jgi:integrase
MPKCTTKEINELIEQIRLGKPPQLPEKVREERYYDPALPGFYILLLDTGVARWVVQYKRLARQKKIRLGDVLVLGRPEAIKAGRELLAKITLNLLDPLEARRERMRANKVTFATLMPLFLDPKRQAKLRSSTISRWKSYLTGYYLAPLHNLPIDEITKEQIQTRIDEITIQSGNMQGVGCYIMLRVFFKWARKTGKLPEGHRNPMDNVERPPISKTRERVLNNNEIQLILKTCDDWEVEAIRDKQIKTSTGAWPRFREKNIPDHAYAIWLLFLTGCRRDEIGYLKWSEVDLDNAELQIPGTRRKREIPLHVPLSNLAVQILRRIERHPGYDYVLGHGGRTVSRPGLDVSHNNLKIDGRIAEVGGTPPKNWTLHDIRRTFRTRLAALGVTADVAEALVGHVGHRTEMDRRYNHYEYWTEKKRALTMWEANLRAIIDGTAEKIAAPRFGERKKGSSA